MRDSHTIPHTTEEIQKWLGGQTFEALREKFNRDGYIIFENILTASDIDALRAALRPYLEQDQKGRNDFEGLKTHRIYALLAKNPVFADLVLHPLAMTFAEAELGKSLRLSACLAINLMPEETVQPWHFDDSHIQVPRPRDSYGLSAFWALDDTTDDNGATEVIPGSHLWPDDYIPAASATPGVFKDKDPRDVSDDPGFRPDAVKVCLPAGSLMLAKGTLWHRGGSNKTQSPRLIITPQYCVGWARQLENMIATMPPQAAAKLPKRAQELLGYNIHPPFMGYVDGMHPRKVLET